MEQKPRCTDAFAPLTYAFLMILFTKRTEIFRAYYCFPNQTGPNPLFLHPNTHEYTLPADLFLFNDRYVPLGTPKPQLYPIHKKRLGSNPGIDSNTLRFRVFILSERARFYPRRSSRLPSQGSFCSFLFKLEPL